jgi:hypothetical protein
MEDVTFSNVAPVMAVRDLDREGDVLAVELVRRGVVRVPGRYEVAADAWSAAMLIAEQAGRLDSVIADLKELAVVGEFIVPPRGVVQRDFQALHIDFGLPRVGADAVAVARFTALHCAADLTASGAATRMVPLAGLLGQRNWPDPDVLIDRLRAKSADDEAVEGVLARVVEALDQTRDLPAKDSDGFLCGMEFASLADERRYFARHGMSLESAEQEIVLEPGELLVFDNLVMAHGRRGQRQTNELHQLCVGFPSVEPADQAKLLEQVLMRLVGGAALGVVNRTPVASHS